MNSITTKELKEFKANTEDTIAFYRCELEDLRNEPESQALMMQRGEIKKYLEDARNYLTDLTNLIKRREG